MDAECKKWLDAFREAYERAFPSGFDEFVKTVSDTVLDEILPKRKFCSMRIEKMRRLKMSKHIDNEKGDKMEDATVYYGFNDAPTVTLVKAVFCEECEYWDRDRRYMALCACKHWSIGGMIRYTKSLDYCSKAQRRSGD